MIYTPEDILVKIQAVSKIAQKTRKGEMPIYYPTYKRAVENYQAILVHADKSIFPTDLFAKRAPNQSEEAKKWIAENYKNVTQPTYLDFANTIKMAFQESNWNIEYSDDDDVFLASENGFQDYVEGSLNKYVSLEGFVRDMLPDLKIQDAMGLICIKPYYIPTTTNENGEEVIAGDTLIEPIPYFYHCHQVVGYGNDYFVVEMIEKSKMADNTLTGRIYEFYDEANIWKATQYGKMSDNTFELEVVFNHNLGELPCRRAGGIPLLIDNEILWVSPFLFAVDLLDIVAINSSYLNAMVAKCAFPATVVLGNPCDFEENGHQCNDGWISYLTEDNHSVNHKCPRCLGTGLTSRLGPLDTLFLKPASRLDPNQAAEIQSSQPPLQYIAPDTAILEFVEKYIAIREEKARKLLHLHTSNTNIKGSEDMTATGSAIDMKQKYAFIAPNAFQLFGHYEFMLNAIGWMRYGEKYNPPTLVYPASFDMENEADILQSINNMVTAGVPSVVVKANIERYIKSIFYTDKESSKEFDLIMDTDRILLLTSEEIALKKASGLVADWEVILHDSSMTFIDYLEGEDENFFKLPKETQQQKLIDMAKAKADEIRPAPIELPQQTPFLRTA